MSDSDLDTFHLFATDLIKLIPTNANSDQRREKNEAPVANISSNKKSAKQLKKDLPKTNSELKQRLQDHLENLKSKRESSKNFNEAEKLARENKKMMKRASKKAKRKRALDKQKDGGEVEKTKGNMLKAGKMNETSSNSNKNSNNKNTSKSNGKSNNLSDDFGDDAMETGDNLMFSKQSFVTGHETKAKGGKEMNFKSKGSKLEGKASKELLKSAEGFKKRLDYLERTNPEEHKKMLEEHAWNKALKQSEGIKVQDDPNKIKKTLKDQERRKRKSKKSWAERDEKTRSDAAERQRKRAANIQEVVDKKKAKKMKTLKKKGRIV